MTGARPPDGAVEPEATSAARDADPVAGIAADLASGRITSQEAVDRLVAHALDTRMTSSAPAELRAKLEESLRAMIETDPHLRSLAKGLGAETD